MGERSRSLYGDFVKTGSVRNSHEVPAPMRGPGSMLISGDVVGIDLGLPAGHEADLRRPAVVVTSQRVVDAGSEVIHVVPLTTTIRGFGSEVVIEPDGGNGISITSAAQCQHVRAVSADRVSEVRGNVGAVTLSRIREIIGLILDIPA